MSEMIMPSTKIPIGTKSSIGIAWILFSVEDRLRLASNYGRLEKPLHQPPLGTILLNKSQRALSAPGEV